MKRSKEQGIYRLQKANRELQILKESINGIEDDTDTENAKLQIDEIRWCIKEGLQDLLEGE